MIVKDFNVALIVVAPGYNQPSQTSNDIALVRLAEAADLSVYTPACLPATNQGPIASSLYRLIQQLQSDGSSLNIFLISCVRCWL